jgi:DNA invertase Pin-like site-specific DNA recombinase
VGASLRETGSHASHEARADLRPPGFDPARGHFQRNAKTLTGEALQRALALRSQGWGFEKIGREFGICEAAAQNTILISQCVRPARRDECGALLPEEIERLREMLRKGFKGVQIVAAMGVSSSLVSHERRRYSLDLKARGKRPLPPPGNGERYSGARISKEDRQEVERLYLDGFGAAKISKWTSVSYTHVERIRIKLLRRLKRKGESLPGCDSSGKRHTMKDHAKAITCEQKAKLRELILNRIPVRRAAKICGIGGSSAYRIRDEIKAELGDAFPAPKLPGRVSKLRAELLYAQAIPDDQLWRFRVLVREHGEEGARAVLRKEAAEARRDETFEQKLQRADLKIVAAFKPRRAA